MSVDVRGENNEVWRNWEYGESIKIGHLQATTDGQLLVLVAYRTISDIVFPTHFKNLAQAKQHRHAFWTMEDDVLAFVANQKGCTHVNFAIQRSPRRIYSSHIQKWFTYGQPYVTPDRGPCRSLLLGYFKVKGGYDGMTNIASWY